MPRTSPDYMSGPHDSEKCGCRHDGSVWTNRCTAATTNDRTEAARWAQDHVRLSPNTKFTPEYLALANVIIQTGDHICGNEDLI